jgi:hypothetical protein
MNKKVSTVQKYLAQFSKQDQQKINKMRRLIKATIDPRYKEVIAYNMISYVIPHKLYPDGYHVDPKQPLSYVSIAQQKNYFSFYHMGIAYIPAAIKKLEKDYYSKYNKKLNHGLSCYRFDNKLELPYKMLENLLKSSTYDQYLEWYEKSLAAIKAKRSRK